MAKQTTKKDNREESLLHIHPEGTEEEVDKEWEDFSRLMTKFKERRIQPRPSQAFYPCPPSNQDEEQQYFDPFDYFNTVMYGRYTKDLGEYAKEEARRLSSHQKSRRKLDKARAEDLRKSTRGPLCRKLVALLAFAWKHTGARLGEDWVFLALLGVIMALISYVMDRGISMCNNARIWLFGELTNQPALQYLAWVSLPVCLTLFSAGFVHIVAPQSIGSGIPEMKTILRGVALKEYLTFRTLVAKVIGLTATLGSGLPLGKEGPFVHIASIVATLLSKLVTSFQGIYENESRNCEMLAAACAVGVASCFAAPIGGVLFSIEVTTVYFAVRNYWRGFFTAVCGATMFRLLAIWFQREETITAMFLTNFTNDFPFDPQELFVFALIGVGSGLGGAFYVWLHRQYVIFMRKNKSMNSFLQKNRFLYPGIVALMVSSVSFPLGLGQFMAGDLNTHDQVHGLFTNFTWTRENLSVEEVNVVKHWATPYTDVFVGLLSFTLFTVAQMMQKEAAERVREEMERQLKEQERSRRPSRFEVIPAPDILKMQRQSATDLSMAGNNGNSSDHHIFHSPVFGTQPKKSILKKTNSFTLKGFSPLSSPAVTPYTTVTGAESRIRLAFEAIFRKSATLQDVDPDPELGSRERRDSEDINPQPHHPMLVPSPATSKKVQLPRERVIDMSAEDQKMWEESEMALEVDFSRCHIDPAPFQLVERTSLLKVHSLFSMVGVNHAYVTAIGRLVGVVALKELRKAIEDANSGILPVHNELNLSVSNSSLFKNEANPNSRNSNSITLNSVASEDIDKIDKV
ncbi:chloride channel protein 2 isoform X7 [Belonocnema kinseyi]|uniref:chloride channel protein 2 isoform X7 n=1 Tax=Belonocnema kinseyi TaxID=2817044 RepID=UPI00143D037E|nr:chloride channel protein 2 isoform X7 [Belonocnema kinseyi]